MDRQRLKIKLIETFDNTITANQWLSMTRDCEAAAICLIVMIDFSSRSIVLMSIKGIVGHNAPRVGRAGTALCPVAETATPLF